MLTSVNSFQKHLKISLMKLNSRKKKFTTSDFLTPEELKRAIRFFQKNNQPKMALLVEFGTKTLLRYSDLSRIRWIDVLNKEVLIVNEKKTGKRREITIGSSLSEVIQNSFNEVKPKDVNDIIFNISIQYVNRILKKLALELKLTRKNISTHTFRKTGARYVWASNGYSNEILTRLSDLLNHSGENITRRYLGISREEIQNIYVGFDDMV
jgi:integrase